MLDVIHLALYVECQTTNHKVVRLCIIHASDTVPSCQIRYFLACGCLDVFPCGNFHLFIADWIVAPLCHILWVIIHVVRHINDFLLYRSPKAWEIIQTRNCLDQLINLIPFLFFLDTAPEYQCTVQWIIFFQDCPVLFLLLIQYRSPDVPIRCDRDDTAVPDFSKSGFQRVHVLHIRVLVFLIENDTASTFAVLATLRRSVVTQF